MAEIKSALELALERTRNLKASDEEKRRWEEERLVRQARALAASIREPGAKAEEAKSRLDQAPESERALLAEKSFGFVLDEASPDGDLEILVRALEVLRDKDGADVRERLRALEKRDEESRRERALAAAEVRLRELDAKGIRGSAVVPNVESSGEWKTEEEASTCDWRKAVRRLA